MEKYYVTSSYGFRKDPYTKRRAFHKGIDLGGAWGQIYLPPQVEKYPLLAGMGPMVNQYLLTMVMELKQDMHTYQKFLLKKEK